MEWLRKHNYYFIHPAFGDLKSTKGTQEQKIRDKNHFLYILDRNWIKFYKKLNLAFSI
ncbi:hypothetical protein [Priestia aryabhattai]